MCGCLSCAPSQGPGLQPRHVPWLGIEPATLWLAGPCSIHWDTPARAYLHFYDSFSFYCSDGCFLLPYLPNHWFDPLLHPFHYWFPIIYSSFQVMCLSFLTGSFFCFLSTFYVSYFGGLNLSLSLSTLPLSSLSVLITSVWTLCLIIVSILFRLFNRFGSVLSFQTCSLVFSFWQPLCVCFYVVGRGAMHPRLGRVHLSSRCSVGSSGTASLITRAWGVVSSVSTPGVCHFWRWFVHWIHPSVCHL